jgi:hypothetical protein
MNRINNLVFDPFKSLNNSETENLDESTINPVIENSYYTTNSFNNLIETKNIASNNLSLLHLNIRSLKNKVDSPQTFLNILKLKFSLIALTETWLNSFSSG